jgi:hypothetical protein
MKKNILVTLASLVIICFIIMIIFIGMVITHQEKMLEIKEGYQECYVYNPKTQEAVIVSQKTCQTLEIKAKGEKNGN